MADEVHGIGVVIDSTGAKPGEDAVVRSLEHIKAKAQETSAAGAAMGNGFKQGSDNATKGLNDAAAAMQRLQNLSRSMATGDLAGIKAHASEINRMGAEYDKVAGKVANTRIAQMEMMHVVRASSDSIAAGARPLQVFAMEIGRVAQAASFMGPALGKVGELMSGMWGLAIVAGISLLATLINHMMKAKEGQEEFTDKVAKHAEQTRQTEAAEKDYSVTLDGLYDRLIKNKKAIDDLSEATKTAAQRAYEEAHAILEGLEIKRREEEQNLKLAQSQIQLNKARMAVAGNDPRITGPLQGENDALSSSIEKQLADLGKTRDAITKARDDLDRAQTKYAVELGQRSQADVIKSRYERKGGIIDQRAEELRLRHASTDEIVKATMALTKQEQAEIKVAQAAESTKKTRSLNYETKDWSSAEVAKLVPGHVISGDRSFEEQKRLYDKYIAYREGRGPFANVAAPPGKSDHNTGNALDLTGTSVAAVRKAANDAHIPIKQLFWEVDHVHFAWKNVGTAANKANQEILQGVKIAQDRAQKERDFWQTMDEESKIAAMLPGEAEKYRKELELQKIRADGVLSNAKDLNFADKMAISLKVDQKNLERDIAAITLGKKQALIEQSKLLGEQAALQGDTNDQIEQQMELEQRLWPYKAKFLADGLNLQDETVKKALDELAVREKTNIEIARRNRLIQEGNTLVDDMNDERDPRIGAQRKYQQDLLRLGASTRPQDQKDKALEQLNRDFAKQMGDIEDKFYRGMIDNVHQIGKAFGGAFGDVLDGIGTLALQVEQMLSKNYQQGTVGAQANNPVSKIASSLQGITGTLSQTFGSGSKMGQSLAGISQGLGAVADGAATGEQVAGIAKSLGWRKFSKTGAEIGGGIGGGIGFAVGGPVGAQIGAFIGSALGGTIGSFFKKTKQGGATLTGGYDAATTFGNSNKSMEAASGAALSIQQGLQNIANTLGGSVGSFNLTIGQRHGDWRVNTGGTSLKVDRGAKDFNDDQQAAIAYAILQAIKQGALTGLSEATSRVMRGANEGNIDMVVQAAQVYENLVKQAAAASTGLSPAFNNFLTGMKNTMQLLKGAGYTYEELANLSAAFAQQQKDVLAELTKGYKDFLNEITNGPSSGKTIFDQFLAAQSSFQSLVAGGPYPQHEFPQAGQTYLDLARQVYGSATPQFEQVRQALVDATQHAIDRATQAAQDALNSAGIIAAIGDTNAILTAMLNQMYGRTPSPAPGATTPTSPYSVSNPAPYGSGTNDTAPMTGTYGGGGGGAGSGFTKWGVTENPYL